MNFLHTIWPAFLPKLLLRCGLGAVLGLGASAGFSQACDPLRRNAPYTYGFVSPLLVDPLAAGAALVLGFDQLYQRHGRQARTQVEDNVREWRQRYCETPTYEDIFYVVYQAPKSELEELAFQLEAEAPMNTYIRQNSFTRYLFRHGCIETIDYLIFAKDCQAYLEQANPWNEKPLYQGQANDLMERGRRQFFATTSDYIRLRYAFQIVRLAHYTRQFEKVLQLYDYYRPKIDNDPSIIEYWLLGHRAGALQALGRRAEAAYDYARIFLHCPSRRESALQSFQLQSDEEWRACYLLCRNDNERATLYALRAFQRNSRALEEMQAIYQLNPRSEYLEVLLAQELRKMEQQVLGQEWNPQRERNRQRFKVPQPGIPEYLIALQDFVTTSYREKQVAHPELWLLAQGYLEMLRGDYYAALATFQRTQDQLGNPALGEQLQIFALAARIGIIRTLNADTEADLASIMLDERIFQNHPGFPKFLQDKLAWLYHRYQQPGKEFLLRHPMAALRANPQEALLDDLISLMRRPKLTRMEIALWRRQAESPSADDLVALKATMYLDQHRLEDALKEFKKIGRTSWDNYQQFDPFVERLNDCINCPIRDTAELLNRGEIMEKLQDLEYKAIANQQVGALYFYRIGLAYYNMSYFGHAWPMMDNFRSGASLLRRKSASDPSVIPDTRFAFGNREHFDCSKALAYFDLARRLALEPELAAKATFMAARCEQNAYFWQRSARTYTYFTLLKTQYANTQFYQRAIRECKYFAAFAAK